MTAYLHVNYHSPTPLNAKIDLKGELIKVERRKTFMRGQMFVDGVMTASCEALFVQPRGGIQALGLPNKDTS